MLRNCTLFLFSIVITGIIFSFREDETPNSYTLYYLEHLHHFQEEEKQLASQILESDLTSERDIRSVQRTIQQTRKSLKGLDFWFRYFDPVSYKKINGPLPVEWETEVFEKFEKPYRREGAGLTLAYLALEEEHPDRKFLAGLLLQGANATNSYEHDSITGLLLTADHFYLCNRLYLLNLATIYTSGFENPDTAGIIPELSVLLTGTHTIYTLFNQNFPSTPLPQTYLDLYNRAIGFVRTQPTDYTLFDHYTFIRDYINPLFVLNQQLILQYRIISKSLVDYSLNKQAESIFSKSLYFGQNSKGIFTRVRDEATLAELEQVGKLLYFDPILSGNNERSCASCHSPAQFFADTLANTSVAFDHQGFLPRNTPTLLNAQYNHLLMADGKHFTLQSQAKGVISNASEMGCSEKDMVEKVLSCKEYKKTFTRLLKLTPQEKTITADHIASAITFYYSKFSRFSAPFDLAMNKQAPTNPDVQKGFNLFMSKAQCGTCHFAPQFNGVKPPYVGSEFEVLGVPADSLYSKHSDDKGRYEVNPAEQTLYAFRTGTLRNVARTKPYMHNGVFHSLEQVIDFYDSGGGAGHGFSLENQTLSQDSLHLTALEKKYLIDFIQSLTESVPAEQAPAQLPVSLNKAWNTRKVGGLY